jgi:capsular polysaccharide biosynthesis protein
MADSFQPRAYLAHLRSRWLVAAVICGVALVSASALSYFPPRKYSASVSLIIEPPATSDPRAALAVSPIYLESLRTYEHFASSDHLFADAAEKFGLRQADEGRSLESLKRSILQVSIPRNTRILRIEATLRDPRKAHDLARHLADKTVELSRRSGQVSDIALADAARRDFTTAQNRLQSVRAALEEAMRQPPTRESLQAELTRLSERRTEVERLALSAALTVDDLQERDVRGHRDGDGASIDSGYLNSRLRASRRRSDRLQAEVDALETSIAAKAKALAERNARIDTLTGEYKEVQAASQDAASRLKGIESVTGFRSERISLLDPGFVPEKPSFPNVPLNLFVALTLAMMVSLVYLTAEFAFREKAETVVQRLPKVVGK